MNFDRREFRKRVLLRLLASPLTLVPFVAGVTIALAVWAFGLEAAGLWLFVSVLCLLGAAGACGSRLLMLKESTGREVLERMRTELREKRDRDLDALAEALAREGDKRAERYLRDLRTLTDNFAGLGGEAAAPAGIDAYSSHEIAAMVEELFNRSVQSLRRSLDLGARARLLGSDEARRPILQERDRLISDVGQSIAQLGSSLATIQRLSAGAGAAGSDLARIRAELDRQVKVAARVQRAVNDLDGNGAADAPDQDPTTEEGTEHA